MTIASILFSLGIFAALLPTGARAEASDKPLALSTQVRHIPLSRLDGRIMIALRTTEGSATINFGARRDELITKARLKLRYTYSPALIPNQSHIKILLNGEALGVIPITKENAGRPVTHELEIDPRLIVDFNRITLLFIGHYAAECEDALHTSLWADVSGASELELTVQPLALGNELARLPEPFFDKHDLNRLTLPFVFAAHPSHATLRAAAVSASWFGQLASWRGARFPAQLDRLPRGHAIVFVSNTERPAFLGKLPPYSGPGLSIMTNPEDGYSKLLLVSGRDAGDLKVAVDTLVLANAALSGSAVSAVTPVNEKPRLAYDAPNWVRLDRPMKFGELVDDAQQLQVFGHVPDTVRVNVRIPPDLFTWRSRGVPVDLKFRYSAPIRISESRLAMSVNDELVQSFNLRATGQGGDGARVLLPLLDDSLLGEGREVLIPAFKLGSRNQLQYSFSFTYQKDSACRDTQVENVRAMIDADSKIDFSGFPNYAQMPHLGYFATAGFPFTKYADLAQTTVVLPDVPGAQDIEVMLTLLGRMGESTGYPATRVQVAGARDLAQFKQRDLLLIGAAPQQTLLALWGDKLPAMIAGERRKISQPTRAVNYLYDWFGFGSEPNLDVAVQSTIEGNGTMAALLGFESPLSAERSVVALTAVTTDGMLQALDALESDKLTKSMRGSAVFISQQRVESVQAGATYTIGHLPFWSGIWFQLSDHPLLLALMSVLAVLIFAFALWRSLSSLARRRLKDHP